MFHRLPGNLLLLVLCVAAARPDLPAHAQNRGETVWIPMQQGAANGPASIKLEGTLYKPEGEGPFPLVIFNHGSTGKGRLPATRTENPSDLGQYLLQRNIALLIPMRRGRGKSEGEYVESYECSLEESRRGVRYAAESLDAVYAFLKSQQWVDPQRIVLAGQSRGGMLAVTYAAEKRGSAIGTVNFVGGWQSDWCVGQNGFDVNAVFFAEAGKTTSAPALFLYATRDPFYTRTHIESYADAFRKAGGKVEFKLYETDANSDGHTLFHVHWRR
jgi:dienelactone hydrolase